MNKYVFYLIIATILISFAPIFSQLGVPNKGVWVYSFYTIFSSFISIIVYSLIKKQKIVFNKIFLSISLFFGLGIFFYFSSFNFLTSISVGFLSQT